jgi:L-lactate utilization protein LutC
MHRTEIESLRLDKLQRQRIVRRLERDLLETRRRVSTTKADAQSTIEARDKAQRDISALQSLLEHEQAAFAAELQSTMDIVNEAAVARRQQRSQRDANGGVTLANRGSTTFDAAASSRPQSALSRWAGAFPPSLLLLFYPPVLA